MIPFSERIDYSIEETPASAGTAKVSEPAEQEIKYGYCTEFIIVLTRPLSEKKKRNTNLIWNLSEIRLLW